MHPAWQPVVANVRGWCAGEGLGHPVRLLVPPCEVTFASSRVLVAWRDNFIHQMRAQCRQKYQNLNSTVGFSQGQKGPDLVARSHYLAGHVGIGKMVDTVKCHCRWHMLFGHLQPGTSIHPPKLIAISAYLNCDEITQVKEERESRALDLFCLWTAQSEAQLLHFTTSPRLLFPYVHTPNLR